MNLAEPLLPVASPTPATPAGASGSGGVGFGIGSGAIGGARRVLGIVQEYVEALGASLGVESEEEARACVWLGLQAHLANAVFTIGRNIGPAMFIAKAGAAQLPIVMFISGFSVIGIGPVFAKWSKGKRAAKVNYEFCLLSAALLLLLPLPIAMSTPGSALGIAAAYMLFLAEDLLPMLLMMQSSSLAQGSLTGHAAKRLLGLIQLGCSTGAMTAGLAIAPLVRTFGSTALLFVQVLLLLASLWPNHMAWWYEDFDEGREGKKKEVQDASAAPTTSPAGPQKADDSQRAAQQPIYRSPMIVALAINTFGIIFCKTIVEYQYNVLLASVLSTDEMVAMTGQLYAAAGFSASVLNVFNSPMMRALGITTTLLICPVSLCACPLLRVLDPGLNRRPVPLVWAAFLGRLVDLTLRWSINNSTKSLLWIATPREMQVRAKPIIEGTVKKMTGSCTAFCIGVVSVILVGDHKLRALALLSAAVAAASSVVCASSGRMYHAAMWAQIDRRELVLDEDADRARQYGSSGLVDFEGTIEIDPVMAAMAQLCPGW
ncbi:hypothetical protein EMIHUDRAFT_453455 [Emiliania huxleyi CCMP1516]|uniref:Solute carrier family 40 protein n=2 Tax=Emiliania huxleyi TaxID=2903 RepID=A0A0D3I4Y4_EMIH1|nr:hypothetical protein EMIHUDRAFT_453455 [Emiliania huxleyi CCMP1516]EOD06319.1 hypothetical protein EMIHUDRAFT_453455 [Emiliania huxleyi CCMP1516]|eukprot:XP_005758748.1 hypothetical protein EMIHUDRAFT_453455 [Emiliania huxleyi CCMP1516]